MKMRAGISGIALGMAVVAMPADSSAQERVPAPTRVAAPQVQSFGSQPRATLGVFLEQGCDIALGSRGDCDEFPRVSGVVEGSPAELAGIQVGDTLRAMDGVSLRSEPGRQGLARLRAGIPVEVEVGRLGGRMALRVIPTLREGGVAYWTRSGNVVAGEPAPLAGFNVFRFRDDSGEVKEFQFSPGPSGVPSPGAFVMLSPDEGGNMQVRVGQNSLGSFTVDVQGQQIELQNLEGHLVELTESLVEGLAGLDVRMDVRFESDDGNIRRHLVLEDPELAGRLENIRVEALSAAREKLELLVERGGVLARSGELPDAYALRVASPEAGSLMRARVPMAAPDMMFVEHRLAGAEFRVLTPELAEYFEADSGLLVLRVIPETPAHQLGLRGGDVVIEVGGHESPDMLMFRELASNAGPTGFEVKWIRKGSTYTGRMAGH